MLWFYSQFNSWNYFRSTPFYDIKDLVADDMHDDIPIRLNHTTSNVPSEAPNSEEMKIYENITYNGQHAEVVK